MLLQYDSLIENSPYLGQKIFVSGFGNLVDGATGDYNPDNFRRMAGTNALDHLVREIVIGGHTASMSGVLLAFDFDALENFKHFGRLFWCF